jgi:hypothetical protein
MTQQEQEVLTLWNEYVGLWEDTHRDENGQRRDGIPIPEYHRMRAAQEKCLSQMARVPLPLAQQIVAILRRDRHHLNAGRLIQPLLHE